MNPSPAVSRLVMRLQGVQGRAPKWSARCPAHEDERASLSIGSGQDGRALLTCHAGCTVEQVLAALGLSKRDLFPERNGGAAGAAGERRVAATYRYVDEAGALLYEVVRYAPKDFRQRRPDGNGGWTWSLGNVRRVLYRLPALKGQPAVFVVEGEKDADRLWSLGLPVTCNPGGAGKWRPEYADQLRAAGVKRVAIAPDHDEPGEKHAADVARSCIAAGIEARLLRLPGLPPKGDVSDWLDAGGAKEDLKRLAQEAPPLDLAALDAEDERTAEKSGNPQEDAEEEEAGTRDGKARPLVALARKECSALFHDCEDAYGDVLVEGHRETVAIRSKAFRVLLGRLFYRSRGGAPHHQSLQDAIGVLEGMARFDGEEKRVFTRLAAADGRVFLDLGDPRWRAVEIDASGWRVIENPPVRFRRPRGMEALPEPARGGSLEDLRPFLNLGPEDGDGWKLLLAWETFALRPHGPFPTLALHGEQGAAKSTAARVLKRLIDPSKADLRAEPRDVRDLLLAAENGLVVPLDNLSNLPQWLSDALCRLSTGGGLGTRELFSDREETLFDAKRPVLLTGIEELATSGDLLDRAILLTLQEISEENRREERDFWEEFERVHPRLLGTLLQAVADTMKALPDVRPARLPRMADFGRWGAALEKALGWPEDSFAAAYARNRGEAFALSLEASPIPPALRALMATRETWEGTATEMKAELEKVAGLEPQKRPGWPKNASSLSGKLRRLAPALRRAGGICLEFVREGEGRDRLIRARKAGKRASGASGGVLQAPIPDAPDGPDGVLHGSRAQGVVPDSEAPRSREPGEDPPEDAWRAPAPVVEEGEL